MYHAYCVNPKLGAACFWMDILYPLGNWSNCLGLGQTKGLSAVATCPIFICKTTRE